MTIVVTSKCNCGHPACSTYQLSGMGTFYQGSGFTLEQANKIAALLNNEAKIKSALKVMAALNPKPDSGYIVKDVAMLSAIKDARALLKALA